MESLVELSDIRKLHRMGAQSVEALSGITMRIEKSEFVAVMGPSGSGKSTLLSIIGCLDRASHGSYSFAGQDVSRLTPDQRAEIRNRRIGFVFQNFGLLPRLSARENVALPLLYRKVNAVDASRQAETCLSKFGLGARLEHQPAQLSGGEQQRVAIARAVVSGPDLILADEPTGALDSNTGRQIVEVFKDLHRNGLTVVLVTHELSVASVAQRIVRLQDGRVTDGSIDR